MQQITINGATKPSLRTRGNERKRLTLRPKSKKIMTTEAVIFDFNGTLFWDTDFHTKAFQIFIERYQNNPKDGLRARTLAPNDMTDNIMGRSNDTIMKFIFNRDLTKEQVAALAEEKEAIYRDLCRGQVRLAAGAEELFDRLKAAAIPFTIASSADRVNIDFYYEELPLSGWIDRELVVYNDGTLRGKPHPDLFLRASERLGVDIHQTTIFEDSQAGVEAAENAGAGQVIVVESVVQKGLEKYHKITNFMQAASLLGL